MVDSLTLPNRPVATLRDAPDVGRLFDQHARTLRVAMYALTGSREAADEIVQETFLLAWRRQAELHDGPALKGWLYHTAYHFAQHHWRGKKRFQGAKDRLTQVPDAPTKGPETSAAQRERGEQVRACISTLPTPYREVFVLSGSADLEGAEIAEILGIPLNTVWTRLHRARALFRARWGAEADSGFRPAPAPLDPSGLWAWLVSFLPPQVLPALGGEGRLVEALERYAAAHARCVVKVVAAIGALPEDKRAAVVLGGVLALHPNAVAEMVDVPAAEVPALLRWELP